MDAQAYLMRLGWDGPGNPLNPNRRPGPHGGLGLTRPILVARKSNKDGVGRKTTKDHSNQWWLRGFEEALRGVGDDGTANESGVGQQGSSLIRNGSELYKFFVRGEGLKGTIEENANRLKEEKKKKKEKKTSEDSSEEKKKSRSKRKRDDDEDEESKEARALRKEERRKKRKMKEDADSTRNQDATSSIETKEERRERKKREKKEKKDKKEKKLSREDKEDDDRTRPSREERKKDKKRKKDITTAEQDYPTPLSTEESSADGSADDEKASSKLKKEMKESKEKNKKEKKEKKEKKRSKTDSAGDEVKKEKSKKRKKEEKSSN
ncbi:hypothetical protein DTO164E3_4690 [Paecilomyces variotii]|nr:hypothetical protein DTO164E3_4690 [Paecilomyces variotii]KAJ9407078.1 hypothetical protein DTO045G8_5210 [Paecilomyces variotii]